MKNIKNNKQAQTLRQIRAVVSECDTVMAAAKATFDEKCDIARACRDKAIIAIDPTMAKILVAKDNVADEED